MNTTIQLHWQDSTGENMFVSSLPGAKQAAITLAISLRESKSAAASKVIEVVQTKDNLMFNTIYSIGVWL